ncbi:MAG: winged helix family transcriptional regulator [Nitrospirae bacterium]|nr:MAG: winged helix family transcriptional regulator [Nitrospirota bacterium]
MFDNTRGQGASTLIPHCECVTARHDLLQMAWNPAVHVEPRTVDIFIARVRRKRSLVGSQAPSLETM